MLSYMDPGSGSLLAQVAVAGFAGAAVAVRMGWRKTAARLDGKRRRDRSDRSGEEAVSDR